MKKLVNKYLPRAYGAYFNFLVLFNTKRAAHKAFTLFCTPRKGKVLPAQASYLQEAENGVERIGDLRIQIYKWAGQKETILLLHGWESNSFRWRNLIGFLQKENYNVIAFDAPAHGKSSGTIFTAPLYAECIHHLVQVHHPEYLIAHSFGGMAALYHQYKFPDNPLKKIITIGSPSELSQLMKVYRELLKYNNRVAKALDAYFIDHFGFAINDFSTASFARKIAISGLLIHDVYDKVTPLIASESVHANWKESKLIKTEGFGHSMHQDQVSEEIVDFLKS